MGAWYRARKNQTLGYEDLNHAICSWCREIDIYQWNCSSQQIIDCVERWLSNLLIIQLSFELYRELLFLTNNKLGMLSNISKSIFSKNISKKDFYQNIKETKNKMSIEFVLLIAFVLLGVGLVLFFLNKKKAGSQVSSQNINHTNSLPLQSYTSENCILALLINADRNSELIASLKNSNNHLSPKDSRKLYDATQALWIGSESNLSIRKSNENGRLKLAILLNMTFTLSK